MSSTDNLLEKIGDRRKADVVAFQAARFGERYRRYRAQYAAAGRQEQTTEFPLYVLFEQTFRCNLRCPSCLQGYPDNRKRYDTGVPVMPHSLYADVLDQCRRHQCPSVAMHNIDEPLLVPDIAERIALAVENGVMDIFMTTNGQLLTAELAQKVCRAGLTHILFSIDAATAQTYARVRVRGSFASVMAALANVGAWKVEQQSCLPIVRASFVVSRSNAHEQHLFVKTFEPLVDYIDIQSFYSVYDLNRHLVPADHRPVVPDSFACAEPFRKIIVRANGDVVPCCSVFGYRQIVGNLYHHSVFEIWLGDRMQRLREQLKSRRFNTVCRDCIGTLYQQQRAGAD